MSEPLTYEQMQAIREAGVAWCGETEFAAILDEVQRQRESLELADKLAEVAKEEPEDDGVTAQDNWIDRLFMAADAYLESRKEGK